MHVVADEPVAEHAVRERRVLHRDDVVRADDAGAARGSAGVRARERGGLRGPRQIARGERGGEQVEHAELRLRDDLGREVARLQSGERVRHPHAERPAAV